MTDDRWQSLMDETAIAPLTGAEFAAGWHFCAEWDSLLIGPGMAEMAYCSCFPESDVRNLECSRMAKIEDERREIDLDITHQT